MEVVVIGESMTEKRFNIIFRGEIVPGANEASVKANVAQLFKANEKVLARLFSGEPIAIKKDVDKAGAMKYRALMKKAGAVCYAQDSDEPLMAARPVVEPTPATDSPAREEKTSGAEWGIAPPGSILVEPKKVEAIEIPDISAISMAELGADMADNTDEPVQAEIPDLNVNLAPVGADMGELKKEAHFDLPSFEGMDIAPVGADMSDRVEEVLPEPPDVSFITVAPVGSDVGEAKPDTPAPKVDISHIKLEP